MKTTDEKELKKHILLTVDDLVSDFLYHDRRDDESLQGGDIETAIENGDITVDDIVAKFKDGLEENGLGVTRSAL